MGVRLIMGGATYYGGCDLLRGVRPIMGGATYYGGCDLLWGVRPRGRTLPGLVILSGWLFYRGGYAIGVVMPSGWLCHRGGYAIGVVMPWSVRPLGRTLLGPFGLAV